MPAVSVVIPTRNRAALLARTLRAVRSQAGVDLEVIVVDDGSTDGTTALLAATGDDRVRSLHNPAVLGVSGARNRGIAAAEGQWVAFCDDDDLWAPDKLALQVQAADQAGAGWVYAGDVNVDDRLNILSGSPPPDPDAVLAILPRRNPLASGGSNVVARADLLAETGGFDTGLHRTEDWDLWIRLGQADRPAWVRRPLVAYTFHGGNVPLDPKGMVDEPRRLAARYGITVDLAAMHRRAAWTALRAGRRGLAVRHYARAVARGDLRSLGRAAVAMTHPGVGSDRLFRLLERDPEWVAEAQQWLAAFHPVAAGERSGA